MAIRVFPFVAPEGFSDQPIAGTHFYSQGLTPSLMGLSTLYSLQNKANSGVITGMGNITSFTTQFGHIFAIDDNGNVLKEQTNGAFDFSIVRSPGGNGAGILGDQYSRLFYATNTELGMYDGTTWNDSYKGFNTAGQHPGDTYEDLVMWADGQNVAVLFSDNSWNASAFSLPAGMKINAIKSGPTGILIGANFGFKGAIILWDGNAPRAKTPWKWVKGQILSIDLDGENWIVKTTRETILTNGYTVSQYFGVLDDPLAFNGYEAGTTLPQQMTIVNGMLLFANVLTDNGPSSHEFGKMKPGLYLYQLARHAWTYIPVPTGNTINPIVYAIYVDINFNNRIIVSYRDPQLNKNYIAILTNVPPVNATFVSEVIGIGRPHYQRTFFGPTEKVAEAAIINLGILNSLTDPVTETFTIAMKIYDFKRQLWGKQVTNAISSAGNLIRVDGTSANFTKAQVGDEITVLQGVNAALIAHISSIANQGASNETWTLDTTFPNHTESDIFLQVQPFHFVGTKTFTSLAQLKKIYFDVKDSIRGTQFLVKLVISGIGTNLQLELQTSYFVFDDLGYDQT